MNSTDGYFIVGIALGILAGGVLMTLFVLYRIKTLIKQVDSAVDEVIENNFLGVNVEKHDDVYRFYDEKTGQFLLQSTTLAGLRKEFGEKFPTKTCYIAGGDEELLEELKQELRKTKL